LGSNKNRIPKVIVGPDSEIKGSVIAHQEIELYVHESAKINGIVGADAIYFSGDQP